MYAKVLSLLAEAKCKKVFAVQKLQTFFSAKNISPLDFIISIRLNKSSTNGFVKLMVIWTAEPWAQLFKAS